MRRTVRSGAAQREKEAGTPASARARPSRAWKVSLAAFSESSILEEAIEGFHRGLKEDGLVDRQDFKTAYRNAQGDIATLNAMFDELNGDDTDLIVIFSTPALQSALRKVARKPVVFGTVLDPIAAGAGKSNADHRANVTGVYLTFPDAAMASQVLAVFPKARRVGTLFAPGEINSVLAQQHFARALKNAGLELVSLPVNGPSEVSDTALALCQSGVDVVCQISDNLNNASFPAIARACEMAKMPLFTFSPAMVKRGAILGLGSDFAENGHDAGLVAARVIRGEAPSRIPFHATTRVRRSVNLDNARRLGVVIPPEWVKAADLVIPSPSPGQ